MTSAIFDGKDEMDRQLGAPAVIAELKQFNKLRAIEPQLTCAEIAYRMVWTRTETRRMLRKMKDNRP